MKIVAVCHQCIMSESGRIYAAEANFFDDRVCILRCPRGHENRMVIQEPKFEILMRSGGLALLSGFTLEACISFWSSFERFLEFAIKVICHHLDMDEDVFKETFKRCSKQSERQLGAFMFLYAICFKEAYKHDESLSSERNKYVHQGLIPTEDRAMAFCKKVHSIIIDIYKKLHQSMKKDIETVVFMDIKQRFAPNQFSSLAAGGPFAVTSAGELFDFDRSMQNLAEFNKLTAESINKQLHDGELM